MRAESHTINKKVVIKIKNDVNISSQEIPNATRALMTTGEVNGT